MTQDEREMHAEGSNDLYCSPKIIRVIRHRIWARRVARMGHRRGTCKVLVGKPEGKRPLRKTYA